MIAEKLRSPTTVRHVCSSPIRDSAHRSKVKITSSSPETTFGLKSTAGSPSRRASAYWCSLFRGETWLFRGLCERSRRTIDAAHRRRTEPDAARELDGVRARRYQAACG